MPDPSHASSFKPPANARGAGAAAGTAELLPQPRKTVAAGLLLACIRGYQRVLSPLIPAVFGPACGCRFAPTCSHYAAEAVQWHGAGRGAWLALRRLLKCTPLHPGGFDPVPAPALPRCRRARPHSTDTWSPPPREIAAS